jgi:DNA-binding beta-propeller fold protein YncE
MLAIALLAGACSASSKHSAPSGAKATKQPVPGPARVSDVYAATRAGMFNPVARDARSLIYVPESIADRVDVIDPHTYRVIGSYTTGGRPQHVVPSWDLRTLYATNNLGDSLTPFDPRTGLVSGPNIPVADPYNLYFTPDGRSAIVVAENLHRLDFRDPHTFVLQDSVDLACQGVDHMDFSADGSYLIASCEYSGSLVKVDVATRRVVKYLHLPGSSPQDVKLDPTGRMFYVADLKLGGVHLIDGNSTREVGFVATGMDAHGLYPSRDGRDLYVSNRRGHSISVIDFKTRRVVATWDLPSTSPDMGGVSPDGRVLWLSGRYDNAVYAISTVDGHLVATIRVPNQPHGLCVWPQPGRYSIGHTGVMR